MIYRSQNFAILREYCFNLDPLGWDYIKIDKMSKSYWLAVWTRDAL